MDPRLHFRVKVAPPFVPSEAISSERAAPSVSISKERLIRGLLQWKLSAYQ